MEGNSIFNIPGAAKYILRSTEEEVEIIAYNQPEIGARTEKKDLTYKEGDWVTYIDSKGKEHIKEPLNYQLDFKPVANDLFQKMLDFASLKRTPNTRNNRIFEMVKTLMTGGCSEDNVVEIATKLVDKIGIDYETN